MLLCVTELLLQGFTESSAAPQECEGSVLHQVGCRSYRVPLLVGLGVLLGPRVAAVCPRPRCPVLEELLGEMGRACASLRSTSDVLTDGQLLPLPGGDSSDVSR